MLKQFSMIKNGMAIHFLAQGKDNVDLHVSDLSSNQVLVDGKFNDHDACRALVRELGYRAAMNLLDKASVESDSPLRAA